MTIINVREKEMTLQEAIVNAVENMRLSLDDDWSDNMDREIIQIADMFDVDVEWIEEQINNGLWA